MSDSNVLNDNKLDSNQRKELIDSLLNFRLILNARKLMGDTIKKNDFKTLVEQQSQRLSDDKVKLALDNLFAEEFGEKQYKEDAEKAIDNNDIKNPGHAIIKDFRPKKNSDKAA